MKAQIYREMSVDELDSKLGELKRQLFELKTQAVTETLENTKVIVNVRRDIARVKTVLHEKK